MMKIKLSKVGGKTVLLNLNSDDKIADVLPYAENDEQELFNIIAYGNSYRLKPSETLFKSHKNKDTDE